MSSIAIPERMTGSRRRFYVGLSLGFVPLVFLGFWRTYFGPLLGGTYDRHWIFHVHGAVFLGWMALLVTQTALAARRRTREHMALGRWGFVWGVAVFVLGIVVSIVIMRAGYSDGGVTSIPEALWSASAPLTDITQFAVLLALGWRYRRKVEFHRRYMVWATVAILPAATARMAYLLGPWSFEILFGAIVAILVARDLRTLGRVHPASVVGLLILLPRLALSVSYKFVG